MKVRNIRKLYTTYHTPHHVQLHMKEVAKLAVTIGKKIHEKKNDLDLVLIRDLALIHDLMKVISFRNLSNFPKEPTHEDMKWYKSSRKKYAGKHDVEVTASIMKKCGEDKLARAVLSQQFDAIISERHPLKTLEEKIVYYADKRIAHTKKVSLRKRLDEGHTRYFPNKKPTKSAIKIEEKIFELEIELSKLAATDVRKL